MAVMVVDVVVVAYGGRCRDSWDVGDIFYKGGRCNNCRSAMVVVVIMVAVLVVLVLVLVVVFVGMKITRKLNSYTTTTTSTTDTTTKHTII